MFGCKEFAHVPKKKWSKFDNKVVKCTLIHYGIVVKRYNIWDPMDGKFFYSTNVIFKEDHSPPIEVQLEED